MNYSFDGFEGNNLSVQDGIAYTGSEEKYISAINRYVLNYENNKNEINTYLESGDLENYRIKVHSLKSNSKMIGAVELSKRFQELELLAEEEDEESIRKMNDSVMMEYQLIIEFLSDFCTVSDENKSNPLSLEEAKNTVKELINALDDFDDELSAKLAKKLLGYPFEIREKEKLEEAIKFIDDFLYDEALEIVKEIL